MDPVTVPSASIREASLVLPCEEIQPTLDFFVGRLGFRLDRIAPADQPRRAWLSGHGLRLELQRGGGSAAASPGLLRLVCATAEGSGGTPPPLTAPNGTRVEFVPRGAPRVDDLEIPEGRPELALLHLAEDSRWTAGRAGMRYRNLIPERWGGRYTASHIQVPGGGPVPDSVHWHAVHFQMIFCARGWVRVVYEDQGPPILLRAGDCVLQPPRIRHRVLESGEDLEVVEAACPAEHDTFLDHDLPLPSERARPERDFDGQRFHFHVAARSPWESAPEAGLEYRDTGIAAATRGLASARVFRPTPALVSPTTAWPWRHDGDFLLLYVLRGSLDLELPHRARETLRPGSSLTLPPASSAVLSAPSRDLELLELRLPAPELLSSWRHPPPNPARGRAGGGAG